MPSKKRPKLSVFFSTHDWCQMERAIGRDGLVCKPSSKKAVQWCVLGAMDKLKIIGDARRQLRQKIYEATGSHEPWMWQDEPGRSKEEVVAMLESIGE